MTNIEQKALALVREVLAERNLSDKRAVRREVSPYTEALCRAIEQHEAFRQEVSNIAVAYIKHAFTVQEKHLSGYKVTVGFEKQADATAWFDQLLSLPDFIIHEPKPDPLVAALNESGVILAGPVAKDLRAALDALGFEIREKG